MLRFWLLCDPDYWGKRLKVWKNSVTISAVIAILGGIALVILTKVQYWFKQDAVGEKCLQALPPEDRKSPEAQSQCDRMQEDGNTLYGLIWAHSICYLVGGMVAMGMVRNSACDAKNACTPAMVLAGLLYLGSAATCLGAIGVMYRMDQIRAQVGTVVMEVLVAYLSFTDFCGIVGYYFAESAS